MRDYKKDLIELIQKRPMSYQQILEENFQKMRTPLQTTREAMICSDTDVFIVCSSEYVTNLIEKINVFKSEIDAALNESNALTMLLL